MKIIVLLGPPGAGKGTQAALLAEHAGLTHLSTGELLRQEIASQTDIGQTAAPYVSKGALVPDEILVQMVSKHLDPTSPGYILDGFPRTLQQALALEKQLQSDGKNVTSAVSFQVDEDEVVQRMALRGRSDDSPDVIRARLVTYQTQTKPLEEFYQERNLLRNVQAKGSIEEVFQRVLEALEESPH
jgi:adenylate kinase